MWACYVKALRDHSNFIVVYQVTVLFSFCTGSTGSQFFTTFLFARRTILFIFILVLDLLQFCTYRFLHCIDSYVYEEFVVGNQVLLGWLESSTTILGEKPSLCVCMVYNILGLALVGVWHDNSSNRTILVCVCEQFALCITTLAYNKFWQDYSNGRNVVGSVRAQLAFQNRLGGHVPDSVTIVRAAELSWGVCM